MVAWGWSNKYGFRVCLLFIVYSKHKEHWISRIEELITKLRLLFRFFKVYNSWQQQLSHDQQAYFITSVLWSISAFLVVWQVPLSGRDLSFLEAHLGQCCSTSPRSFVNSGGLLTTTPCRIVCRIALDPSPRHGQRGPRGSVLISSDSIWLVYSPVIQFKSESGPTTPQTSHHTAPHCSSNFVSLAAKKSSYSSNSILYILFILFIFCVQFILSIPFIPAILSILCIPIIFLFHWWLQVIVNLSFICFSPKADVAPEWPEEPINRRLSTPTSYSINLARLRPEDEVDADSYTLRYRIPDINGVFTGPWRVVPNLPRSQRTYVLSGLPERSPVQIQVLANSFRRQFRPSGNLVITPGELSLRFWEVELLDGSLSLHLIPPP